MIKKKQIFKGRNKIISQIVPTAFGNYWTKAIKNTNHCTLLNQANSTYVYNRILWIVLKIDQLKETLLKLWKKIIIRPIELNKTTNKRGAINISASSKSLSKMINQHKMEII